MLDDRGTGHQRYAQDGQVGQTCARPGASYGQVTAVIWLLAERGHSTISFVSASR